MNHRDDHLRFAVLDRRERRDTELYDAAYRFWKAEWREAFLDQGLRDIGTENSDKFWNADEIMVMSSHAGVVGLGLISYVDMGLLAGPDLGYFKVMPPEAWLRLQQFNPRTVMTSGYNIVAKRYRRRFFGGWMLSLLLPATILRLFCEREEADFCMGMPLTALRNDKLLRRLGMRDLHGEPIRVHGVEARFMGVTKEQVDLGTVADGLEGLNRLEPGRGPAFRPRKSVAAAGAGGMEHR